MTDYEARFTAETGLDSKSTIAAIPNDVEAYNDDFVDWLIQTADKLREELSIDERLIKDMEEYYDAQREEDVGLWKGNYETLKEELQYWHERCKKAESDRDELIELAAMCVDTMDEEEYPTTIKHVNDAINRIRG